MLNHPIQRFLIRSTVLVGFSFLLAIAVNAGRDDPLAWTASSAYEIYEDCPETTEPAAPILLDEILENRDYFFLVDSREAVEYETGHAEGAFLLPFDPLFSVEETAVSAIQEAAGDRSVVVIGDGLTAQMLADDLSTQGLEFVHYLEQSEDWRVLMAVDGDKHDTQ